MQIPTRIPKVAWWFVLLLAGLQGIFMILEIFFWPFMARQVAKYDLSVALVTRALGANMGLYNGFLAAGLVWSLRAPQGLDVRLALFFVSCVLVAGLFGITVSWGIAVAQAFPAVCALVALSIDPPSE